MTSSQDPNHPYTVKVFWLKLRKFHRTIGWYETPKDAGAAAEAWVKWYGARKRKAEVQIWGPRGEIAVLESH